MGYIKEPPGVDFVINSGPLSPKDAALISAYIKTDKAKRQRLIEMAGKVPLEIDLDTLRGRI
jgi:hypothetical protein